VPLESMSLVTIDPVKKLQYGAVRVIEFFFPKKLLRAATQLPLFSVVWFISEYADTWQKSLTVTWWPMIE